MLELKSIYLNRNKKQIFRNFNLNLKEKQIILLLGQNGTGKTTLLEIITGLIEPTAGEVKIFGKKIEEIYNLKKNFFTYLPHKECLKDNLTVHENLISWLELTNSGQNYSNYFSQLNIFDLTEFKNTLVRNLSHGQKKKITLTKLLLSDAKLWLLDEPLNGIDLKSIKIFKSIVKNHLNKKGSIIITSHIDPNFKNCKKVLLKKYKNKKSFSELIDKWENFK